jgi:hypothetical protein
VLLPLDNPHPYENLQIRSHSYVPMLNIHLVTSLP